MIKQVPNLITLSNLCCGVISLLLSTRGEWELAAWMVIFGATFDFFDGTAARLLKVSGELGKQLDSLADLVSFGVAPSFLLHFYLVDTFPGGGVWNFVVLVMIPFAAYRLAKFNIDKRQTTGFIGLATPSNAMFWIFIPTILNTSLFETSPVVPVVLAICSIVFSLFMVSEFRFFSLKFNSTEPHVNRLRYIMVGLSVLSVVVSLLIGNIYYSTSIIILLYVCLSVFKNIFSKSDEV